MARQRPADRGVRLPRDRERDPPTTFQPIQDPQSNPPEPRDRSDITRAPGWRGESARSERSGDTPTMPPLYRADPVPPATIDERVRARRDRRRTPIVRERRHAITLPDAPAALRPARRDPEAPIASRFAFGPIHLLAAAAALLIGYYAGRSREAATPTSASAPASEPEVAPPAAVSVDPVEEVEVKVEVASPAATPEPSQPAPRATPRAPAPAPKTTPQPATKPAPKPAPTSKPASKPPPDEPYADPPPKPPPPPASDDPYGDG